MNPIQAMAIGFGAISAFILGAKVGRALGSGSELPGPEQGAVAYAAAFAGLSGVMPDPGVGFLNDEGDDRWTREGA